MRRLREITAEEENFRLEEFGVGPSMLTIKRDPVEPEPVGTVIVKLFRITGYDPDCDGSLLARIENIDAEGRATGWSEKHLGLYPDTTLVLDAPDELHKQL